MAAINGLQPLQAYQMLLRLQKPFEDPLISWYAVLWYFNREGILCRQQKGRLPETFPSYQFPKEISPVLPSKQTVPPAMAVPYN